jgi:subtilase family serine protease
MIRKLTTSFLALAALLPVANMVCQAAPLSPMTRHVRDVTLNGEARSIGRLPGTQQMRLTLVLPHRNQAALSSFLKDVYDPANASYRHFLTVEEFTSRFGPSQEDYDAVVSYAKSHGFTVAGPSPNRMNVDITGSVANIEEAFHLNMGVYQHPTENRTFFAPDREPTVDLGMALWHISGLDNYSIPSPALVHRNAGVKPNATTGSCPSISFCGSDMRAAYYGGTLTGAGQSLGLVEYEGTDLADLTTYFTNTGQTNSVPITLKSTDGTSTSCVYPRCDDTEPTIDMTQAIGMAPGLSSLVMYIGSRDVPIFNAMATANPLNAQLSCSWTWYPADPATDDPYFEEFAAQGQSFFQAAGDTGVWNSSSKIFPADDANVITVGGTDLVTSAAGGAWSSETVWSDGGGGISPDLFAIPTWQTAAASGCSECSTTYRNGPDVAANSNFSFYVCSKQAACTANDYGGTSFAAPMWAAYVALANQQSLTNGTGTIGFINPAIYAIGLGASYNSDFNDVVSGSNGNGSVATVGYDTATGWGSPNGANLLDDLIGTAPPPGFTLSAPVSASIAQGKSAAITITSSVMGGFDSPIALSASGQPTGVTITFSPASINGRGTSAMTITVALSTVPGTYSITVTGTSGSITASTVVSLTVTATPATFTIAAAPKTITVAQGGSGSTTITTTISGPFDSAITLSASGEGVAQKITFSPSSIPAPGSGTSTVSIKVGPKAKPGKHTITITGTGGGVTKSATFVLDITK